MYLNVKIHSGYKAAQKDVGKLSAAQRKKIPASKFDLPSERKYLINNRSHAANAKARATQMVRKGRLSASSAANRVLGGKRG